MYRNYINSGILILAIMLLSSCTTDNTGDKADGNFEEDWESLSEHHQAPEWFADAKFGIYFTWGVYCVPEYATEWYPFGMYREGSKVKEYHTKTYGPPSEFNYHDFVPMFTAENFDSENWAQLFQDAGARFAGPCAQHHDGFAMWESEVNPWNVNDRGPHQDITGKLEKSITKRGMKFITTFHHARNLQRHNGNPDKWDTYSSHFVHHPDYATSSVDPDTAKLYGNIAPQEFHQYWFDQLKEVIDNYSPDIIYFDSWLKLIPAEYRKKFAAYYLNDARRKGKEVVITYKQEDLPSSLGVLDIEQGGKKDLSESVWMTDVTLSNASWSYVKGQTYKSAGLVIRNMIDVWSKNGVVLLNVSPDAKGNINQEQREILKEMGRWMKKNAEAVYNTRPFGYYGFGNARAEDGRHGGQSATTFYTAEDGRFLKSKDGKFLYLFMLGKPLSGTEIEIRGLAVHTFFPEKGIKKISLLGTNKEVEWYFGTRNFYLKVPDAEMDSIATVFKMELN